VVVASALLPGLGHLIAGRTGSGAARAVLAVLWLVGGIALVVVADGAVARLPGVVLLAGAVSVWAATLADAAELARGGVRELLAVRTLLWLVVVVTGLLIVALSVVALRGLGTV